MSTKNAQELYYSPEAIERFTELELATRHRQFGGLGEIQVPEIANPYNFITTHGNDIIMSPLFGAWLDRKNQLIYGKPEAEIPFDEVYRQIYYIGNYATSVALLTGRNLETTATLESEHIMIPELGRVAMLGHEDAMVKVLLGDEMVVASPRMTVRIPRDSLVEETPDWQPLRHIGPPDFRIALNDIDPNRRIFRYPVANRVSSAEHQQWHRTFTDAWDFIQEHDPQAAALVRASLNTIVPAPTEPLTHGKSMSAGAAFGVVGINEHRDPARLASHIIFSTRKHLGMALRDEQPSFHPEENPAAHKPVYPPTREGYTTAMHLLDDSFINIGLARFFNEVAANARPNLREYASLSFARWFYESHQNMRELQKSGYATEQNHWVVAALEQELLAMAGSYSQTPNHLKQIVTNNALDRYVSWRLHNSTPDAGAVTYLRDVWLRGEACPPLTVAGELSQSIAAYTHIGQRTRYALQESRIKEPAYFTALQQGVADPERFGAPTPGDIAFANQNIREARNYFLAAVQQAPRNPETWSGLAATFAQDTSPEAETFRQAPELLAAVYAAIGDSNVHPQDIAIWLAPCRVATAID